MPEHDTFPLGTRHVRTGISAEPASDTCGKFVGNHKLVHRGDRAGLRILRRELLRPLLPTETWDFPAEVPSLSPRLSGAKRREPASR